MRTNRDMFSEFKFKCIYMNNFILVVRLPFLNRVIFVQFICIIYVLENKKITIIFLFAIANSIYNFNVKLGPLLRMFLLLFIGN